MNNVHLTSDLRKLPWAPNTAAHRWYGFGRYFAMFPPAFAHAAVEGLTWPGEPVLDPFCGRGNGPFTATVLGRPAVGVDVNPVGWLFTIAKLHPTKDPELVIARLENIAKARRRQDRRSRNKFETMAWAPGVRAFLRTARRELDWQNSEVDRTLMAFIALHMQDKAGDGLSNALWPSIACSPQYAVRWWTRHDLLTPPDVDPVQLLSDKIRRRYQYGTPVQANGTAFLADAREALPVQTNMNAALLLTSPPYCGVTDYWNDHWIRLWLLGYSFRKDWKRTARFANTVAYENLISEVFQESQRHLIKGAAILVRSDQRRQTAKMCIEALKKIWPHRKLFVRRTTAPHKGISVHHGRGGRKAQELDLLIPGSRGGQWWKDQGFQPFDMVAEQAALVD